MGNAINKTHFPNRRKVIDDTLKKLLAKRMTRRLLQSLCQSLLAGETFSWAGQSSLKINL
jgi:hypothetical protein